MSVGRSDARPPADQPGVVVVDYDPSWPELFQTLRGSVWSVLSDFAITVEHVGSTSVPGLAAKPVIDVSVVVATADDVARAIRRLATLGYRHRGNLGISGREAFWPPRELPPHHLYVCPAGSPALANHLAVRDHLRGHPESRAEYGALKKRLARRFRDDIDGYIEAKSEFLLAILSEAGLSGQALGDIEAANRRS